MTLNTFRRLFLFAVFLFGMAGAALAAEVTDADAVAIRTVITAQLDAFAHDDAPRAFSYATDGIRARFGAADVFLAVVRTQYAVVYRPKSVKFEKPFIADGQVLQPVKMTDGAGNIWIAIYPMQRSASGTWRIDGCQLQQLPGQAV